jgi:lysozyme
MSTDPRAIALIARWEGCLRKVAPGMFGPYICPAGVPTIGEGTIKYPDGNRVTMRDPAITQARARELLMWEVDAICRPAMTAYVKKRLHPLSDGALVSFAYNCGTGALRRSTLLKRVNAGRWSDVPKEFRKWRMGGGRVLRGLANRREAEIIMFMQGVAAAMQGDYGDAVELSPAPTQAPPLPNPTVNPPTTATGRRSWGTWLDSVFRWS